MPAVSVLVMSRDPNQRPDIAAIRAAAEVSLFAAIDLAAIVCREHLCGFAGSGGGERGVHVAGRDRGPVPGPLAQRGQRAGDQAGLSRHLNHGVPALLGKRGVRLWLGSVRGTHDRPSAISQLRPGARQVT
jgi:hypothetical protein